MSYNKNFVQPLIEGNINKGDLNKKYKEFRTSILFIFEQIKQTNEIIESQKVAYKGGIIRKIKINDFTHTLNKLFQKYRFGLYDHWHALWCPVGQGGMGTLLVVGPQGDVGCHHIISIFWIIINI